MSLRVSLGGAVEVECGSPADRQQSSAVGDRGKWRSVAKAVEGEHWYRTAQEVRRARVHTSKVVLSGRSIYSIDSNCRASEKNVSQAFTVWGRKQHWEALLRTERA
ncbi:hypothetical protein NDU88_002647 [Pleurodeles waltl]|uniref:Uncharacterized protein n=1 Tax=Pleurodeles waltl TaxID=8319 RepID=A0AAV7KWB7_PLEWA|nr:hypothetical protein NDU88_002647 [Pleurodeles waltl]